MSSNSDEEAGRFHDALNSLVCWMQQEPEVERDDLITMHYGEIHEALRLAALIEDGKYLVVPVQPTYEMLVAASNLGPRSKTMRELYREDYMAMLTARPPLPTLLGDEKEGGNSNLDQNETKA